jgi:hypothetical protein
VRLYHDWQPEVSVGHKINKEDAQTVEAAASNLGGEIFLKLNKINSIFTGLSTLSTLFNTVSSPQCRRMLGLNPGLL